MTSYVGAILQSRDLLLAWTGRTIRARYQQSALGWAWALILPIAQTVIFTIIFTRFVPIDTGNVPYIVFSYVAMVPWTFLASSLPDMSNSIVFNMNLVTKIYFPREVLPLAAMLARFVDFGISAILLIILILIFQIPVSITSLLFLPLILALQILLIIGLGFGLAAANVFFRDIQSVLTLMIQLWFYASPIIYPVTSVPESLHTIYFLNPMAGILTAYRDILIFGNVPGVYLVPSTIITMLIFVGGYWFFKRAEFLFADIV